MNSSIGSKKILPKWSVLFLVLLAATAVAAAASKHGSKKASGHSAASQSCGTSSPFRASGACRTGATFRASGTFLSLAKPCRSGSSESWAWRS